jgi:predicted double-glycine peptidase
VTVSEESLKKAKGILANDEEPPQKEEEFVGFSTGKNKRVTVSEESLKKAKGILANDEEPPQKEEEFVGFSTGKNKRVTVSEESLKKAKGILANDEEPPQKEEEFVGFSTGKNKRVTVSEESLKKAKGILASDEEPPQKEEEFVGFSTGKNKRVTVSEESMKKAAGLLEDEGDVLATRSLNTKEGPVSTKLTASAILDDEFVQDNPKKLLVFGDEEVKRKEPLLTPQQKPSSRLSTSSANKPTASASKTKPFHAPSRSSLSTPMTPMGKRGVTASYQTPMKPVARTTNASPSRTSQGGSVNLAPPVAATPTKSLIDLAGGPVLKSWSDEDFKVHGVKQSTLNMTFETALGYRFDRGATGPEWFRAELLKDPAVKEDLLSLPWVENHYALIVWKLACMERSFPDTLGGLYMNKLRVLKQLQSRYATEIASGVRPIFRKVAEKDDEATRYMVVVVTRVIDLGEDFVPPPPAAAGGDAEEMDEKIANMIVASFATIEVTDGWYVFRAKLDAKLTEHLAMGRIFPGLKLKICGARLQGVTEACPPLELPESAFLALSVNGCRRAKWNARLGLRLSHPFPISIRSVQPGGGTIPRLDIVILRVMPLLYSQKDEATGHWSSHDSKAELEAQAKMEMQVSNLCAARANELKIEFEKEDASRRQSGRRKSVQHLQHVTNEDVLYDAYLCNPSVLDAMNEAQRNLVLQLERRIAEEREMQMVNEVQAIQEKMQKERQVMSFLDIEVADCPEVEVTDLACIGRAVIRVYSPGEEMMENILREGKRLTVLRLEASRFRSDDRGRAKLKTGKSTMWQERSADPIAAFSQIYKPRLCTSLAELTVIAQSDLEFDWMGSVLQIAPSVSGQEVIYFFSDGTGDGLALAVEGPIASFKCNYETRGEMQPIHLKNLTYRMFDAHQRLHVAVASVRTEILKPSAADCARFAAAGPLLSAVNQRMQAFVGFSGAVSTGCHSNRSMKLVAAVQPFLSLVYFPSASVVACVPSREDVCLDLSEWCASCSQTLSACEFRSSMDGLVVVLDDGFNSWLCKIPTRCLEVMLAVPTRAMEELSDWMQVLLRSGRCVGSANDEDACGQRLQALKKVKAGELATPATILIMLVNASVETSEAPCGHAAAAQLNVAPMPIIMTKSERLKMLDLLWNALTAKRWMFSVIRSKETTSQPWKSLDGEVESVSMLVDQVCVQFSHPSV